MKKSRLAIGLVLVLSLVVSAQTPAKPKTAPSQPAQTQQAQQPKPEDPLKNLVMFEKTAPPPDRMKPGFESITAKDSIVLLTYISSDLMEGRETATRGYDLAADYAASLMALWNVKPGGDMPSVSRSMSRGFFDAPPPPSGRSYLQKMALRETLESTTSIELETRLGAQTKTRVFKAGTDFSGMFSTPQSIAAPVVFAGYGITEKDANWDDFKGLDIKGKIVLILSEAPGKGDPKSPFEQKKELKEKYFQAAPAMPFVRMGRGFNKTQEIVKLGPAAILVVSNTGKDSETFKDLATPRAVSDERPIIHEGRRKLSLPGVPATMPWESSPTVNITREMADAILEASGQKIDDLKKKIESTLKPASLEVPGARLTLTTVATTQLVTSANVVGYIEGSDPVLKNEVVIIGAHYDHLGKRGEYVYNGADDNGSGSVGVMNVARAFAQNPVKPKRSVMFCLWTGEEQGLLGSRFYVQNPVFPIDKTVAYFNLDMISRPFDEKGLSRMSRMFGVQPGDEVFKKIKPADFVSISFTADSGLDEALKAADEAVGLQVMLRAQGPSMDRGSGGSDHSSFARVNIPWVFPFLSITDEYHQTSDSVEKVSGTAIERVSRLAYLTLFNLADK